jgi:hypothetical protein
MVHIRGPLHTGRVTVRKWQGHGEQRGPQDVWSDWTAADDAGETDRAMLLAAEMLRLAPTSFHAWFHAGLLSKALGKWAESLERNARAVELFTPVEAEDFEGVNPAAWNLGIASTALGDWATARRAWAAYGIGGMGTGYDPIDSNFGLAPIRLNPDQPSLPHQVLPSAGATEVSRCPNPGTGSRTSSCTTASRRGSAGWAGRTWRYSTSSCGWRTRACQHGRPR